MLNNTHAIWKNTLIIFQSKFTYSDQQYFERMLTTLCLKANGRKNRIHRPSLMGAPTTK